VCIYTHTYEKTKHHSEFLILGVSFSIWILSVSVGHSKSYPFIKA